MRRHLVRVASDAGGPLAYVSEAYADISTGTVGAVNNEFEHLTCFAGGMLVLGEGGGEEEGVGRKVGKKGAMDAAADGGWRRGMGAVELEVWGAAEGRK